MAAWDSVKFPDDLLFDFNTKEPDEIFLCIPCYRDDYQVYCTVIPANRDGTEAREADAGTHCIRPDCSSPVVVVSSASCTSKQLPHLQQR